MNEVFLEIVTAKFTAADFEKHQLLMPANQNGSDLKLVFFDQANFNSYLNELEKECDNLLSQYWLTKSSEMIEKNKFVISVITVLKRGYLSKFHCSY